MKKNAKLNEPTIDAQQFKRRLLLVSARVGNRKRISASLLFALMMEAVKKVQ
jgi:hypothetical protein